MCHLAAAFYYLSNIIVLINGPLSKETTIIRFSTDLFVVTFKVLDFVGIS